MTRGHVNVDMLPLHVGPRARCWLALVTVLLALAFCIVLFVLCTIYWYEAYRSNWRSNTVWRARLWIPYLVDADRARPAGAAIRGRAVCLVTGRAPPFGISETGCRGVARARKRWERAMSPPSKASIVLVVTLLMLLSGIPVAFGLGAISIVFLVIFQGFDALHVVAETFWSGLDEFTLVSIPMFVMMGAAIGSSPAGKDLYEALDRWLYRLPGGLVDLQSRRLRDLRRADRLVARLLRRDRQDGHPGDAPARLSGRRRHRLDLRRRHARHPDPAVDHLHPLRHRHRDLDRPAVHRRRRAGADADRPVHACGRCSSSGSAASARMRPDFRYTGRRSSQSIPKIAPFLAIIVGVMYVLYGGVATPSEAAGVGAALCVHPRGPDLPHVEGRRRWWLILRDTMRESVMILTIIAAAVLFGYMLTSLYLTQTLAQAIADLHVNRWVLMVLINVFLLVCGFFIPPAAIILMTSPDPAADHHRGRLRPGLVRRDPHHQHGDRPDPSAGRAQHLHRQRRSRPTCR